MMKKINYSRIFTGLLPNGSLDVIKNINRAKRFFAKILKKTQSFTSEKKLFYKKIKKPFKLYLLLTLMICSTFLLIILTRMQLLYLEVKKTRVEAQKQALYWGNVVKNHPDYPDAYYQAAWYLYVLGEKQRAYEYLNKVLSLDPRFKAAQELREKLLK